MATLHVSGQGLAVLAEDEDLNQTQGIENDQKISQTLFANADSMKSMAAIQARFDGSSR